MAESAQSKCYEMLGEALYAVGTLQTERDEAWDLIDRLLPYTEQWDVGDQKRLERDLPALLIEIEEKRAPHG